MVNVWSASSNPLSRSPSSYWSWLAILELSNELPPREKEAIESCKIGAFSAIAASTSVTGFRTSYSTSIKDRSSSASWRLDAATAAIGCPLNKTLSEARMRSLTYFILA